MASTTRSAPDPSSQNKNVDTQESNASQQSPTAETPVQSKQQRKGHEKAQQAERSSLLDVINFALQQTERTTYLHRLTYVGQHSFKDSGEGSEELDSIFQMSVNQVNENYYSEELTGCFIYYSKYFIHIVEGAEDSIGHHVRLIVKQIETYESKFGVIKIILRSHHIRKRYFGAWFSMYGVPNTLLDKIQGDDDEVIAQQIENFHKKIVTLASHVEKRDSDTEINFGNYLDKKTRALFPETNLLDYLLKIRSLEDINDFLKTYQRFPHMKIYADYCWPPIMEFVPYNLYIELPEIPKLEIPPYCPIEELEVKERVAGYLVDEKKGKKSSSKQDANKSELGVLEEKRESQMNVLGQLGEPD